MTPEELNAIRERAERRRELSALVGHHNTLDDETVALCAEVERLTAEVAEARADGIERAAARA